MQFNGIDFANISASSGAKVLAVYQDIALDKAHVMCKLSNLKWAFFNINTQMWFIPFNGNPEFADSEIAITGWAKVAKTKPVWAAAITMSAPNSKSSRAAVKEAPCICSSLDIFNFGCQAARGLPCYTMQRNEKKGLK